MMKEKRIILFSVCFLIVCGVVWYLTDKNRENPDSDIHLKKPVKEIYKKTDVHELNPIPSSYDEPPQQSVAGPSNSTAVTSKAISSSDPLYEESHTGYDDNGTEETEFGLEDSVSDDMRILEIRAHITEAVLNDYDQFSKEELNEITALYEEGIQHIDTEDGRRILADLYQEYPESNRGGCAAMNLAVYYYSDNQPEKAMGLVDSLIGSESNSVYYNGAQVLPAALFLKGQLQEPDEARETFERLLKEFPDAIDSNGDSYYILIDELMQN
ncbi:MAG: tetratricopeptide repeat protein [Deltaproteobacteria bacterium]|nr:tetratricopeptide repeat protein [Deltaproteobacteria bacterium]